MDFIKKIKANGYVLLAACLLTLAGLIVGGVSAGVIGYSIPNFAIAVVLSIVAMVAIAAAVFFGIKENSLISGLAGLLAAVALVFTVIIIASGRAELFVYVFVVDGPAEVAAFGTAVASLVLYVLSFIGLAVSGFMDK